MKKFGFAGLPGKKESPAAGQGGAPTAPRRRRRWIIVGAAALAAALGCAVLLPRLHPAAAASSEDLSLARTVTLEKGRLDNTVSVSGTVQSATVSTVTTTPSPPRSRPSK
jgi:multidrug efflux pump subunit AcrA (membrane-fusion protein)